MHQKTLEKTEPGLYGRMEKQLSLYPAAARKTYPVMRPVPFPVSNVPLTRDNVYMNFGKSLALRQHV